jgi:SAM-dependent methyltransferase
MSSSSEGGAAAATAAGATVAGASAGTGSFNAFRLSVVANVLLLVLLAQSQLGSLFGGGGTSAAMEAFLRVRPRDDAGTGSAALSLMAAAPTTTNHWPDAEEGKGVGSAAYNTSSAVDNAAFTVPCESACTEPSTRCVREMVYTGGAGRFPAATLQGMLRDPKCYGVESDLALFTGLSPKELHMRMQREGQFHFTGEHAWWAPASRRELTWYYRWSVSYLFANAIHCSDVANFQLRPDDGPVLEYSGGVGNNVIHLASNGVKVTYFGIGEAEAAFARFRVANKGLEGMVDFVRPYVRDGSLPGSPLRFEPIFSVPDKQYGVILAMDVLEHIPDYHVTLEHLVSVLRPGGVLLENTPFSHREGTSDTAIHVRASRPLNEEMARLGMKQVKARPGSKPKAKIWVKGDHEWTR